MNPVDEFCKLLNEEEEELMRKLVAAGFPEMRVDQQWKGNIFMAGFSVAAAKHMYDNIEIRESDVLIVSYPKTGNTWVSEVVRKILYKDESFHDLAHLLPFPFTYVEIDPVEKFKLIDKFPVSRRLYCTHLPVELINMEKFAKANAKIIYVLRNPKDQIVSWYKFAQAIPQGTIEPIKSMVNGGWDKYFEHVVAGDFPVFMKAGEWYPENVREWSFHQKDKNVYFVFFEDMKKDLSKQVKLLADFMGETLTDERVEEICEACGFDNMKKDMSKRRGFAPNSASYLMRKGGVGGWKDYFTVSQSERIDAIIEDKLKDTGIKFTYEL